MSYEVEMKFPVLGPLDFEWSAVCEEVDTYYRHPCRDFAQTDEGLRIRRSFPAMTSFLTYKGPKIDSETKTRQEIEFPLFPETSDGCQNLLEALGFRPVEVVRKFRKTTEYRYENREYHLCLDSLPVLKDRGLPSEFLEIETIAEQDALSEARESILRFAQTLIAEGRLGNTIRKGYLEMILDSNPPVNPPVNPPANPPVNPPVPLQ